MVGAGHEDVVGEDGGRADGDDLVLEQPSRAEGRAGDVAKRRAVAGGHHDLGDLVCGAF